MAKLYHCNISLNISHWVLIRPCLLSRLCCESVTFNADVDGEIKCLSCTKLCHATPVYKIHVRSVHPLGTLYSNNGHSNELFIILWHIFIAHLTWFIVLHHTISDGYILFNQKYSWGERCLCSSKLSRLKLRETTNNHASNRLTLFCYSMLCKNCILWFVD